jgi:hypothetical protein
VVKKILEKGNAQEHTVSLFYQVAFSNASKCRCRAFTDMFFYRVHHDRVRRTQTTDQVQAMYSRKSTLLTFGFYRYMHEAAS